MPVLLALVLVAGLALAIAWFLRANPSSFARGARRLLIVLGLLGVGGLLVLGVRFLPSVLPELMGLVGVVVAALIARAVRWRPSGGFSTPGSGQRTEVRTALLQAWIDHASGDVGGTVLAGRFAGRSLDALSDAELKLLHQECAADSDSLRILEAYMDRRLGSDWRGGDGRDGQGRGGEGSGRDVPPHRDSRQDMTREEALAVLGLSEGVSDQEVRAAHRRLIQRVHPDVGGSVDLAARINRAKDVLLGG